MQEFYRIDVKHVFELLMLARFSYYHRCRPRYYTVLIRRLREIAGLRGMDIRRLRVLLKREGWNVNAKVIYKLYRKENLGLQRRKLKKIAAQIRVPQYVAQNATNGGRWILWQIDCRQVKPFPY